MANVKISGLPTASTPLTGAELVPVVQSGVTSQTTVDAFNYFEQDGTGAVATTVQAKLRETVSVKDFGAVGDGVTDDTAAIQAALTAAAGKTLVINPGSYNLSAGTLSVPAGTTIIAYGATLTWSSHVTGVSFIGSTSLQSNWFGGKLVGAGNASFNSTGIGMYCIGTAGTPPTNVFGPNIDGVRFDSWGSTAIWFEYTTKPTVTNCKFISIGYIGVCLMSSIYANISNNYIANITPGSSGNAYGVAFTRNVGSLSAYPRSSGSACFNTIKNISIWKGLDTHGGEDILFDGNKIYDCKTGISVTTSSTATVYDISPQKVIVSNNTIIYSSNDGTAQCGVELTGGYDSGTTYSYASDCIIQGNNIYGHGANNNVNLGSLRSFATKNVKIVNNVVNNSWGAGIQLTVENLYMDVSHNTITDVFDNNNANVNMLWINSINQSGRISDNVFNYTGSGTATYKCKLSIEVANVAGLDLDIGQQTFIGIDATHLNMYLGTTTGVNTSMTMRQRGTVALSGGAATVTFNKRFPLTPTVIVTPSSALNAVRAYNATNTQVSIAGTGSDTVAWEAFT